jgi:hypothetical protein
MSLEFLMNFYYVIFQRDLSPFNEKIRFSIDLLYKNCVLCLHTIYIKQPNIRLSVHPFAPLSLSLTVRLGKEWLIQTMFLFKRHPRVCG